MGESAGAVNVYALMTSPLVVKAKPSLVHRVLPMSGGISRAADLPPGMFPVLYPASVFETQANALLAHLLVADGLATDAASAQAYVSARKADEIAGYLRGKSADAVLSTGAQAQARGNRGLQPDPRRPRAAREPHRRHQGGPIYEGAGAGRQHADEGKLFPGLLAPWRRRWEGISGRLLTDEQAFSIAFAYDPDACPATKMEEWIPAAYSADRQARTGYNARMDALNNHWFRPLRDNVLDALKTQQDNVWYYSFEWDRGAAPFNEIFGAAHAFDLPFVFGNFGPQIWHNFMFTKANRPGELALADAMMRSIGAFARNGIRTMLRWA
jgi:para-nitrobenzyl esterase